MPPPLDRVGLRRFAFYPSILNADPNEWMLSGADWSEAQVVSARTGLKLSIPRRYIGAVSETDDPILIVGLTKELEYREGAVWPRIKRVIEMPLAVNESVRPFRFEARNPAGLAPVIGIRLENRSNSRTSKLVLAAGIGTVVLAVLAVGVFSDWIASNHAPARSTWQSNLKFSESDGYDSIVKRLGPPASDHWRSGPADTVLRALAYPRHRITIILQGTNRQNTRYLATMNARWHVAHQVSSSFASHSEPLGSLPRF